MIQATAWASGVNQTNPFSHVERGDRVHVGTSWTLNDSQMNAYIRLPSERLKKTNTIEKSGGLNRNLLSSPFAPWLLKFFFLFYFMLNFPNTNIPRCHRTRRLIILN
jgi:hypothetical protein